jgi:HlyD family secretion protein
MNQKIIVLAAMLTMVLGCQKQEPGIIQAPGLVQGEITTLKAQTSGTVQTIYFQEGSRIKTQDLLITIDPAKINNQKNEIEIALKELHSKQASIEQKVKLTAATLKYLKTQLQRFQRLQKSDSVAGEKVESMELKKIEAETGLFELKQALIELDIQREKLANKKEYLELILNDHRILSPVSGTVLEVFVHTGESVFPNVTLLEILDNQSLYVDVFIEENELANLAINQAVTLKIDGLENRHFAGTISYFGQKAEFSPKYIISEKERKSLLYQVKVKITEPMDYFKVGMPVTVIFHPAKKS